MAATVWTEDFVDRLERLWRQGRSAAWIAREFGDGFSRSAVLGKIHRLELSRTCRPAPAVGIIRAERRASPAPCARPPARFGPTGPGRASRASQTRAAPRPVEAAASSGSAAPPPPMDGTASILTVRGGDCRWPYGHPGAPDFALCGRPAVRGVYCAAHAPLAYQPGPRSAEDLIGLTELV